MSTRRLVVLLIVVLMGPRSMAQLTGTAGPDLVAGALRRPQPLESGVFPRDWIWGDCLTPEPTLQVHAYNEDFYILRQSACTNFEAPFQFLIFGAERVILFDTGAGGNPPIGSAVSRIIQDWLMARGQASIELIVAHTHGHSDHFANDGQFAGIPDVTIVGTSVNSVKAFFGITNWPTQVVSFDLGDRVLDIIPAPGHQSAHIVVYDRRTGILLTGDSVYPGFLFIQDFNQYRESIGRLVAFTESRPVSWVFGNHVEMTTAPGVPYSYGTVSQPNERVPQLRREHLAELHEALIAMGASPTLEVHDDFIITP